MFCQCGREVFSGDSFCSGCGKSIQSASVPSLPPQQSGSRRPVKKGRLWNFHTWNWVGHCPTCHLAHASESARCPNDDSPLVMAFNCSRWNPFEFPMQTAHLHCGNNCGYTTTAFQCPNDGTVVTGQFIEFKPPLLRVILYNICNTIIFLITAAVAFPFLFVVGDTARVYLKGDMGKLDEHTKSIGFMYLLFLSMFIGSIKFMYDHLCYEWLWKFVRTFDLEAAQRVPPPPEPREQEPRRKG